MEQILVKSIIKAPISQVWEYWTSPKHIVNWNFANNDWHCPKAENNLVIGGEFHYLMSAKDGSFSFDFWGTYVNIIEEKQIEILLGDERQVIVLFECAENGTLISERFDPETENAAALQQTGWQMILDNFKLYVEK